MLARIDSSISFDASSISPELRDRFFAELSMRNPDKDRAMSERIRGANFLPDNLSLWETRGRQLLFPRGFVHRFEQIAVEHDEEVIWDNAMSLRPPSRHLFRSWPQIELRDYQIPARDSMLDWAQGIFQAPTGSGKSVTLLEFIRWAGQKTIVIVGKTSLASQWRDELREKCAFEPGYIGEQEWKDGDIVIALWQSLWSHWQRGSLGRDFFDSFGCVVGDECVPSQTMIETPLGPRPVEDLSVGDEVLGYDDATGSIIASRIEKTFVRWTANEFLEVAGVEMTPEHPVWTPCGYVPSKDLTNEEIGILDETKTKLQLVPQTLHTPQQFSAFLFTSMQPRLSGECSASRAHEDLSNMQQHVHSAQRPEADILQFAMRSDDARTKILLVAQHGSPEQSPGSSRKASSPLEVGEQSLPRPEWRRYSQTCPRITPQDGVSGSDWRKWSWPNEAARDSFRGIGCRMASGACSSNEDGNGLGLPNSLQDRPGIADPSNRSRDRWQLARDEDRQGSGRSKDFLLDRPRMDGPQIRQQGSSKERRSRGPIYRRVYNLETETGNYFANGLLVHNCHHASAASLSELFSLFPAFYRIGASATPNWNPLLYPIVQAVIGPVIHRTTEEEAGAKLMRPTIRTLESDFEAEYIPTHHEVGPHGRQRRVQNNYSEIIAELVRDPSRNDLIASTARTEAQSGHHVLIVTRRIEHVKALVERLEKTLPVGQRLHALTGSQTGADARRIAKSIANAEKGTVLISTVADEGLDMPRLDRIILSFPLKRLALIEQQIGRIRRQAPGKLDAIVYDVVDRNVGPLDAQRRERSQLYMKRRWPME